MQESGRTKAMLCELVIVALFLALSAMTLFAPLRGLQRHQPRKAPRSPAPIYSRRMPSSASPPAKTCLRARNTPSEGETYAVLSEIQTEVCDTGALEHCTVTVQSGEETLLEMQTACYRPERSAP